MTTYDMNRNIGDANNMPAQRSYNIVCINCNEPWSKHSYWSCDSSLTGSSAYYNALPADKRFTVPDMIVNNPSSPAKIKPVQGKFATSKDDKKSQSKDISNWQTWAHNRNGDCACGITKSICSYHR